MVTGCDPSPTDQSESGKPLRILCADDDENTAVALKFALERAGNYRMLFRWPRGACPGFGRRAVV